MPMYLDRHDLPGISPEALAEAHRHDVAIQDDYGVCYHTYWFDPDSGSVFCLAEGPSREAIETVHREAHGQLASEIIELDPSAPLNNLFGPLPQHPTGTPYAESAVRAIVFTDLRGSVAQTHQLGDDGHILLLREHDEIVRAALANHAGREVKHTGDGIMAAFSSVSSSVKFAIVVQQRFAARNETSPIPLDVGIGISAGEPVTADDGDLFGAAVQLAARLCAIAAPGDIAVSVAVRELTVGKSIEFEDRGRIVLKGLPDPIQTYAVAWR